MHINPDHYLETTNGRIWTSKRNKKAWQYCLDNYSNQLRDYPNIEIVYLLIGCQGAGKSTWAELKNKKEPDNIIFDAILVRKSEREFLVKLALKHEKICVAVHFTTNLSECLSRNRYRKLDKRADESAVVNVFKALEEPSIDEGFTSIIKV